MGNYYIEAPFGGASLPKLTAMVVEYARQYNGYLATEQGLADLTGEIRDFADKCHAENPRCTPVWVRLTEGYQGIRHISLGTKETTDYSLVAKVVRGRYPGGLKIDKEYYGQ